MGETHDRFHDRYRMLMDIYEANEKLNSRADNKATSLLTLSGAITSVGILFLTSDYIANNSPFVISIVILIFFNFISMLFLVHAIRPFFRRNAVSVESHGVFFYKDILQCKDPVGYKTRVDAFEADLEKFLDSMELSIFAIAQILQRKFRSLDLAVTSIFLGLFLLVITAGIGQFF